MTSSGHQQRSVICTRLNGIVRKANELIRRVRIRRDPAIVRCAGIYDISRRDALYDAFATAAGNPFVIADFEDVESVDSTAIAEVLRAHRHAQDLGGTLVLVTQNKRLIRVLSIAGVTAIISITDTVEDALALLR